MHEFQLKFSLKCEAQPLTVVCGDIHLDRESVFSLPPNNFRFTAKTDLDQFNGICVIECVMQCVQNVLLTINASRHQMSIYDFVCCFRPNQNRQNKRAIQNDRVK